jgi:subtilisin family serine protease
MFRWKKREKKMKKAAIFQLVTLVVALCLLPSDAFGIYRGAKSAKGASTAGPEYKKGEVLVKFRPGVRAKAIAVVRSRLGLRTLKHYPRIGVHHLSIARSGLTVREALKLLRESPEVLYAEPNYKRYIALMPNDPRVSELWGLHNIGQAGGTVDADIDAPEAWDITTGSSTVVVGVIDSGVDYTHPDLAANMWVNPGEIPGNSIDDEGNGYVDDVYGIDTANGDSNPMDDAGHGTHVSGTIGAVGNNGVGVVGVNWNVRIMALKFLDENGGGWTDDAIECLDYATMMKTTYGVNLKLTSNSWGGGGFSQALEDAIAASGSAGMLFMAAAGNDGTNNDSIPHYPSNYDLDNILAVAATDRNDNLASFSSYGVTSVDLGAPGVSILSTTPGNTYSLYDGTSMATPHVAGAAALLWADDPTLTPQEVRQILFSNVDPVPSLTGRVMTGGRLNVYNALTCGSSGVRYVVSLSDGFTAEQGIPLTLSAYLTECSFLTGASMTASFSNGDTTVPLADDGVAPDVTADDGVYTGSWLPNTLGPVTVTFTALHGIDTYTATATSEVVEFAGYYYDDTTPYNWIEISGTGTPLHLSDDDEAIVPLPFPISFYDASYNSITIGSNGDIFFENNYSDFVNICIPGTSFFGVDTYVAPFWTDLYPPGGEARSIMTSAEVLRHGR